MKKAVLFFWLVAIASAGCQDGAEIKVNLDSAGKKFDTTARKVYEDARKELDTLTEKIENRVNRKDKKDSTE